MIAARGFVRKLLSFCFTQENAKFDKQMQAFCPSKQCLAGIAACGGRMWPRSQAASVQIPTLPF